MKKITALSFLVFSLAVLFINVNAIDISFGDLLTAQETEGYKAFEKESPYNRYEQAVSEIPEKVVLQENVSVNAANVFYVSMDGNDSNDGRLEGTPFATVKKALSAVAQLSDAEKVGGTVIYICSGEYIIDEPLQINSSHTGSVGTLYISAYGGEAVLSQSIKADGSVFKKITKDSIGGLTYLRLPKAARENGYYFDYADAGISKDIPAQTEMMYFTDHMKRFEKARYPDAGHISVDTVIEGGVYGITKVSPEWIPDDNKLISWNAKQDIYLKGRVSEEWTISDSPVSIIGNRIKAGTEVLSNYSPVSRVIVTQTPATYYLYNIIEELTVPGEWYADNENKRVYFIPYETPADDDYIKINCGSTGVMRIYDAQNVVISGLTIDGVSGGINVENSEKILIQDAEFTNIDGNAVVMKNTFKCGVINSDFKNIKNGTAVIINTDDYEYYPRRNFVQNSYLYNCEAAMSISSFGNIISNNTIHKTQGSAVFVGLAENIVEYNEFVSTNSQVVDAGAIYIGGSILDRNNHIRYNYFHDSRPREYESKNARGVYLDDTNESNFVYGNIFENLTYGVLMHTGDSHVIVDNVALNCTFGIANSADYRDNAAAYERYFSGSNPFFVQNYIQYGIGAIESWTRRNGNVLTDKYNSVISADAKFDAATDKATLVSRDSDVRYLLAYTDCYVADNVTSGCTSYGVFSQNVIEKYLYNNTIENNSTVNSFDKNSIGYFDDIGVKGGSAIWNENEKISLKINGDHEIWHEDFRGLSWTDVSGADYYILTVSPNRDLTNPIIDSKMVLDAEYPLERYVYSDGDVVKETNFSVEINKKYYVQITAKSNADTLAEKTSPILEFTVSDTVYEKNGEWFRLTHGTISDYVEICGVLDDNVFFEEKYVNALVYEKDCNLSELMAHPEKIKYIVQIPVNENNEYSYKFKLDEFENYGVLMKIGDDEVVTDLENLDVRKCVDLEFEFATDNTAGGIAQGDTLQASAEIDNYFNYVDRYYMVIAVYDRNNKLIDAKLSDEFVSAAGMQTQKLEYVVPEETAYAKAFIMDKNKFAPLYESKKIEND